MKLNLEILAVETTGSSLRVRVQGKNVRAADWQPYLAFSMELPDTDKSRRAFYVGRRLRVAVEAKG